MTHINNKVNKNSQNKIKSYNFSIWKAKHTVNNHLDAEIKKAPFKMMTGIVDSFQDVFNYLLQKDSYFNGDLYMSQDTIAQHLGISLRTVSSAIRELSLRGIISKINRGKTSCRYKINKFFRKKWVKRVLRRIFPSIWKISDEVDERSYNIIADNLRTIYKRFLLRLNKDYPLKRVTLLSEEDCSEKVVSNGKSVSRRTEDDLSSSERKLFDQLSPELRKRALQSYLGGST